MTHDGFRQLFGISPTLGEEEIIQTERILLIREVGSVLVESFSGSVDRLISLASGSAETGLTGDSTLSRL